MIGLSIGNSYSKITGLSPYQDKVLRNILSYDLDPQTAYFAGGHRGARRCLMNKRGEFPTGLLEHVYTWLRYNQVYYEGFDLRKVPKPTPGMFKLDLGEFMTPYPAQLKAINAAMNTITGTIAMPTGSGKSLVMALLINALQLRTLIVVPTLGLKHQLTSSMKKWFGDLSNITIENIDSSKLKTATNYDLLIIDEAHRSAAKTYRDLNKKAWTGIYRRYFFTATPHRSKEEEQLLLESITGPVIYRLDYKTAVAANMVVPIEAYYIELPKVAVKGHTWSQVYSELVVNNKARNVITKGILTALHADQISTLCLVKEINHGKNIGLGAFASGEDPQDCQQLISWFNNKQLTVLTATTGVCGEGVDTKPAEYVIIAGLGKSKNQFMQQVGRVLRTYPGKESGKIIIFKDKSHKWTLAHFKQQCKILREEYGVEPIKLEIV